MKNTQEPNQCQHKECTCPIADGDSQFCSENCEQSASGGLGEGCQCGHAGCN